MLSRLVLVSCGLVFLCGHVAAEEPAHQLAAFLSRPALDSGTPLSQVQEFTESRVPRVPEVSSIDEWETLVSELRSRVLDEVILRGKAAEWASRPTNVEWLDVIEGGPGYRIRKLRYEAVPGMWVPALLYEPTGLSGRVPVVMNVNGHDGTGKAADYKQLRCINQAKRGMLALNVEWLGMGQLRSPDFAHYRMNQLDLCGTSGIAPFYLSLKRGLDVLLEHEHADPERVAVAGLSGGGWQTIFISGLDPRVTLANPVAGYSSFRTRARVLADLGDSEQTPSDLATVLDYTHLTAMRAPHPTLLTNNDRDRCCYKAGDALPLLLEESRPIYRLYDASDRLWVHINHVPGSHNFEQDNREALYRALSAFFSREEPLPTREILSERELKSAEELAVPLPEANSGFNTLARQMATSLPRPLPAPEAARSLLQELVKVRHLEKPRRDAMRLGHWNDRQVSGVQFAFDEWIVPATVIESSTSERTLIVLSDGGRSSVAPYIANRAANSRVVAVDLFYFGESRIPSRDFLYGLLVAAVGERPLGIQVSQLLAIASNSTNGKPVDVLAIGPRQSLIATVAAALRPDGFRRIELHGSYSSLREIIDENLQVSEAPELFCFGLFERFDIPQLKQLAEGVQVQEVTLSREPTIP